MSFDRCAALLKSSMGLDVDSIGTAALERAVHARAGGMDADTYWYRVSADEAELQALIEEIVVSETWFFRDPEAFAALARTALERLAHPEARALRLLSLPCSSGEEPYSMAMALFDAGLHAGQFTIDAFDISERALAHARRAVYGRNSFRGQSIGFRARYFTESALGWALDPRVRDAVQLGCANLFEVRSLASYDFVFCRNLLIYFDRAKQIHALDVLGALLAEGATMFVGPAESGLMMLCGFTPLNIPLAFAFGRPGVGVAPFDEPPHASPSQAPPARAWLPPPARVVLRPLRKTARVRLAETSPIVVPPPLAAAVSDDLPALAKAAALADAGRLDEAVQLVETHLAAHGPSAHAFYLHGLFADARRQDADARAYYRKALYLDPMHHEALTHLSALLEMTGDRPGARLLAERAARAAELRRD